jgi:DNA-binding NarL/FixJ family response regulator
VIPETGGDAVPEFRRIVNHRGLRGSEVVGPRKIRVLVADSNPLLREGLSVLIRFQPDMDLAAVVATAEEAVELFGKLKPDVTLMDLDLPSGAGVKAIRQIRNIDPSASVIGLFTYEWDESIQDAVRAGARSCLAKDQLNEDLVALIHSPAGTD